MDTLNFDSVSPNKVIIEKWENQKESFFSDVYQRAEKLLRKLVDQSGDSGLSRHDTVLQEHPCRLIAFTGNRGTGKTSAMATFVKACQAGEIDCGGLFCVLPIIEPIQFKAEESLVGTVVSHLYSMMEKMLEEQGRSNLGSNEQLRDMLEQFTAVREALRVQGQSAAQLLEQNSDELSHLRMLAQTSRLSEALSKLISSFLSFWHQNKLRTVDNNKKPVLIIPIDDMDTAVSSAFSQIEELYHYLMLPDVVVVMALKLEQLSDALEEQFIQKLSGLWASSKSGNHALMDAQPAEMAMQYILKVIPRQCRVEMPGPAGVLRFGPLVGKNSRENNSVSSYFVQEIRHKTGILLVPDTDGTHALLPQNLRSLHQLYVMLKDMSDLSGMPDTEKQRQIAESQLRAFEGWIFESLFAGRLDSELIDILRLFSAHENRDASAFLWRSIVRYCSNHGSYYTQEVSELLNRQTINDNITMGDVLYLLRLLRQTYAENSSPILLPAVRALYSVKMRSVLYHDYAPFGDAPEAASSGNLLEGPWCSEESKCEQIQLILNGLIYDPVQKVTYDGLERIFNRDATIGTVRISAKKPAETKQSDLPEPKREAGGQKPENEWLVDLRGTVLKKPWDEKHLSPMTIKEAVWSSLFITACGRVRSADLHTLDYSAVRSVLARSSHYPTNAEGPAFVSANWMAFIHNLLMPKFAAQRMLWLVRDKIEPNQDADANDEIERAVAAYRDVRTELIFRTLHVDSADFLDEMVWYMRNHTDSVIRRKPDDVAVMKGYFNFADGLREAVLETERRWNPSADQKTDGKHGEEKGNTLNRFLRIEELKTPENQDKFAWLGGY